MPESLRIVHVTPFYSPSIGGVETIVKQSVEELARRGHEVFVVTTNLNNRLQKIADKGIYNEGNVTIIRLDTHMLRVGYASIMKGLKDTINRLKPDIVHCHNLHPHLFQAVRWKDSINYRVVAQLHYPIATGIDHLLARILLKPTLYYLKLVSNNVDAFIVHTNIELSWLRGIGIADDKIFKVKYPSISIDLIKRYCCKKDREKFAIYIGRIDKRKGLHILLQAISLLKSRFNIKFIIAGPKSDEKYYSQLKLMQSRLGLKDVEFIDPLPDNEKYEFMSKAQLFVHPALLDYTPVTLIEAQALGLPVVASAVGGIPELIKHGSTGLLVKPGDPKELATALNSLLDNTALTKMREEAVSWITENFLLENNITTLENIYKKLSSR